MSSITPGTAAPNAPSGLSSIAVLDYGSQYTRLITRRLREFGVYSVILPGSATLAEIEAERPRGVILSGGPASVYDAGALGLPEGLLESKPPALGDLLRDAARGARLLGVR